MEIINKENILGINVQTELEIKPSECECTVCKFSRVEKCDSSSFKFGFNCFGTKTGCGKMSATNAESMHLPTKHAAPKESKDKVQRTPNRRVC